VVKKWEDTDKADQYIKEDVGQAPRLDQQNCRPDDWRDDRHCDDRRNDGAPTIVTIGTTTTVTAATTIVIGVGRTT
jgi:hypothetical protein